MLTQCCREQLHLLYYSVSWICDCIYERSPIWQVGTVELNEVFQDAIMAIAIWIIILFVNQE